MYSFSQRSLDNLKNVDERLVRICNELIKLICLSKSESTSEKQISHLSKGALFLISSSSIFLLTA